MSQASPAPPAIPDYELLRLVGRGAYGDVWLARGVTGVYRAIKIVWRDRFENADPYEREFRGLKQFAAISILESRQLALLHVGRLDDAGCFYYVMEPADDVETGRDIDPERYVPNTLKELRTRRGRLLATDAIGLGADLARALAGLHARGLVHRDIKPSNVILVGGAPKLADVGLVTTAAEARTFVGTEGYVPPEGPGTPAADVYAMGRVLYEVATGRDGRDFPTLPPNFNLLPDRRELLELNEVIVRACEPDAQRRHRDATAVLDDLLLLQAGKSVRRLRSTERHLARALRATVVLAIAAAVAGAGAWIAQQRADREMALREKAEADRDAVRRRAEYSANLARAQSAIDNDALSLARRLLLQLRPPPGQKDLRGFEWRALWHEARGDPHEEIRASGPEVVALFLSPDESTVAVHDKTDDVALYDVATGRESSRARGIRHYAGFSRDGKWLIGADPTGAMRRWSSRTGTPEASTGPNLGVPVAVLDGTKAVAITDDATAELRVWDFVAKSASPPVDLGPQDRVEPWLRFLSAASPDGRDIVQAWRKGSGNAARFKLTAIRLGDTPRVRQREVDRALPAALGVDDAGPWAFFDGRDNNAKGELLRCGEAGWEKTTATLPEGTKKYVALSDGGAPRALIARMREIAWLEAPPTGTISRAARGHGALLTDLVVSTRHQSVISAAKDGSVFRWPLAGPWPKRYAAWPSLGATAAAFLPDAQSVWVPQDGKTCVRLDLATLAIRARAEDMVYPVAIAGDVLLGVSPKAGLTRVNAVTGEALEAIGGLGAPVRWAAASTDLRRVAMLDHAGNLFAAGAAAPLREGLQRWYRIVLDPDGQRLLAAIATTRTLVCLSWPDGAELWRTELSALATDFLVRPERHEVVVALEDGALELRDLEKGGLRKRVDSGSGAPQTIALLARENRLLVAGIEGELTSADLDTGESVHATALGRNQIPHRMISAPDGKSAVVLTRSGTLHVIRTD